MINKKMNFICQKCLMVKIQRNHCSQDYLSFYRIWSIFWQWSPHDFFRFI